MAAFLSALKDEKEADMVTIIDTTNHPYSDVKQLSLLGQPKETCNAQAATMDPE